MLTNGRLALLGLMATLVAGSSPAWASPYDSVVVFGDSNVDNGNLAAAAAKLGITVNPPPNYGGRNNNGPVVVEYLAQDLGIPLQDYAFSGATTGSGVTSGLIVNTLQQITNYLGANGGKADPNALYVYWAGSNDLLGVGSDANLLSTSISGAIANVTAGVDDLGAAGAGTILVANRTPRTDLTSQDNLNGIALNTALAAALPGIDEGVSASVPLFDDYSLISDMITDPSKYGFLHTAPTDICINDPVCSTNLSVASTYVFWDAAHKTTRVHEIMAEAIAEELGQPVPEPMSLAVLGSGGLALVIARRRKARQFGQGTLGGE